MNSINTVEGYLNEAFKMAYASVRNNIGGPFGAVIVINGMIIGEGGNRVISQNDPTAHAEIVAIREACKHIGNFDLSGAVLYATCEPCPMCLSAIYWANIHEVFYCLDRYEAEAIGFKDNQIYKEISLKPGDRTIAFHKVQHKDAECLFREWTEKQDKLLY